ncbi:MAG: AmmeMemoRadiSam system radical SAM enzyme [Thermoplasmata archaeon]|nr:AmmeMemoRadiSam system radical SAM enzyme [Thermoplasmata archaeon]
MSILDRKSKGSPKEAMFWEKDGSKVRCDLCPHKCHIAEGKAGICRVRENRDGTLYTLIYGKMTSMNPDPIEKKPLFHFHPGSESLSFGTIGCNFKCQHCQNWTISQVKLADVNLRNITIQEVVDYARKYRCDGISWTYNEPIIWYEFTLDGSIAAKEKGLYTSYVTNGFMEKEPLVKIAPYLDAMNIDIKAFNEEFYAKVCKGRLAPCLETAKNAHDLGIHVELTYLVIPTQNDDMNEIADFIDWAASISRDIPLHFSRFHPDYKMVSLSQTPMDTLEGAFNMAREKGMRYVYLGNVMPGDEMENTYCPKCNELLIQRWGFTVQKKQVKTNKCPNCGESLNIKF